MPAQPDPENLPPELCAWAPVEAGLIARVIVGVGRGELGIITSPPPLAFAAGPYDGSLAVVVAVGLGADQQSVADYLRQVADRFEAGAAIDGMDGENTDGEPT
ncbi:hypothetical protein [Candidatus Poriferisodalis sp.]|uniref:hypothetical protein n=1 Tax=Candidatus Poriferisodalis sp. TaxID=3101277 RepID=UPI003B026137